MQTILDHLSRFIIAAFFALGTFYFFNLTNSHRVETETVDAHQPTRWLSYIKLVGDGNTYSARTTDTNHAIYDQNNQIVAVGVPEERPQGQVEYTFVSSFKTIEGSLYSIDESADLFSDQSHTVQLDEAPPLFPQAIPFLLCAVCFVILTFRFIVYFF